MTESEIRRAIVEACRTMDAAGLNQGTSGNIGVRLGEALLITPSATPCDRMAPEDIAAMPIAGDGGWCGPRKPSVEWRLHRDIFRARAEIGAVVHAHAPFATALAIARMGIPACHYMVAAFGGADIRCSGYARFGTPELSAEAVRALDGRLGCLLANHGMIAVGPSLERAMWLAGELEALARQYWHALQLGGPILLSDAEIAEALRAMSSYGG